MAGNVRIYNIPCTEMRPCTKQNPCTYHPSLVRQTLPSLHCYYSTRPIQTPQPSTHLWHVLQTCCIYVRTYSPYHTIPPAFNPDLLDGKPHTQPIPTLTKTLRYLPGRCTTWDDSSAGIKALLKRCQQFYKYQGFSIRACYEDFDRHNRGLVTESQFYRNFPGEWMHTQVENTDRCAHTCARVHAHRQLSNLAKSLTRTQ